MIIVVWKPDLRLKTMDQNPRLCGDADKLRTPGQKFFAACDGVMDRGLACDNSHLPIPDLDLIDDGLNVGLRFCSPIHWVLLLFGRLPVYRPVLLQTCMRGLVIIHVVLLIVFGSVMPVQAQLSGDDLLRLGIQILNGANGAGQQPVPRGGPRAPPANSTQPQAPARDLAAELEAIAMIGAPLNESEKRRREEALRLA
ncbi:hypothetical protein [Rhizobium mongolense]|uniref:Uncharacterized protein n=2 Tax=Rhizobium mongolense TaxID=57676 RepID=A0ABR6IWI2_9HYPH|nr:hypothetical protein [Rhizobium mongolense]MBB4232275.1 hypothetical protein [Rhizobium mongolense]TVZ63013.1 hypothetical protein BCL32_3122 [Rhizobium mongolense USDA 1844]